MFSIPRTAVKISVLTRSWMNPLRGISRGLKTHSGAAKRFRRIASGKFKRSHAGRVHLHLGDPHGKTNDLNKTAYALPGAQTRRLKKLMPFS